jgi:hypothetical protein
MMYSGIALAVLYMAALVFLLSTGRRRGPAAA